MSGLECDFILHVGGVREPDFRPFGPVVGGGLGTRRNPRVLVFGDSISAGYGLARVEQGWVALLQAKLKAEGYGYEVVNASVTGETTAGGLARLPRALSLHHPAVVVLELGGNDGLRALPIEQMRDNLAHMIDLAKGVGAQVLLLGIRIPPNYGPQYTAQFGAVYTDLAREKHVPVVPFFMSEVALDPRSHAGGRGASQRGGPARSSWRTCGPPSSLCSSTKRARGPARQFSQ